MGLHFSGMLATMRDRGPDSDCIGLRLCWGTLSQKLHD